MSDRRPGACAAATVLVLAASPALPRATAPHPGPPIWADLVVSASEVRLDLRGEVEPLARCIGYDGTLLGPLAVPDELAAREAVLRFLAERVTIAIDGAPRDGRLSAFELPVDDPERDGWLFVEASWSVAVDALPRQVGIVWSAWEGTDWMGERYVPILVRHGRDVDMTSVWPAEPEYVWHAREQDARAAPPVTSRPVVAARPPPAWPGVVLCALAVALAALGSAPALRARARARGTLWAAAAAALACGGLWLRHARAGVVRVPAQDQALALFGALQADVYAAFDADGEDAIYELLAQSVEPGLLDGLYSEVYESLVLREEGGAMCTVEELEVLESEVDLAQHEQDAVPSFRVDSRWRVHGLVAHWGHVHRRTNEYDATYTLRHDGVSWKIAAVDVNDHRRLEQDG